MAHALKKDKKVTFLPGHPSVPAYPGQPWLPARTASESRQVCVWKETTVFSGNAVGYAWKLIPADPNTGSAARYVYVLVDASGNVATGGSRTEYIYSCTYQTVIVQYPGQPYIPPRAEIAGVASQTLVDLNLGWNAGARSVGFLKGPGKVEFKVPQTVVGAVVGINDAGVDPGYTNIENAWYFTNGLARVFELGVSKFYSGPYVTGDRFAVKRVNGIVSYWKNDALVYTSVALNTAEVFLDASLYAGDDSVYDPEITELMFGGGEMAPLYGSSNHAGYPQEGRSYGSLRPLTGQSYPASRSAASLAPFIGLSSDRIYGQSVVSLQPLEVESIGGMMMPSFSIANTAILYLTGGGTGLTGEIGGSNSSLPAFDGLSSGDDSLITLRSYGEAVVSLQPMIGVGYAYEGNTNATMMTIAGAFGDMTAPIERFVVMNSDLTMATYITVTKQVDGTLSSNFSMLTNMDMQATLEAVMTSLVMMSFGVPVFDDVNQSWVVNANTGASSRYEDFPFNSFGKIGKSYYGCKSDGLYLLEGSADGAAPIRASVNFGNSNFGTSLLKGCTNAYLGLSSTGNMYLKVAVDDKEYIYSTRASSEAMKAQRVDIGRGIRANYLQFEIYNNDGCDFELDSVEFLVVPLSRRI